MLALLVLILAGPTAADPVEKLSESCETGYPRNPTKKECHFPLGKPVSIVAHGDIDEGCKFLHTSKNRTCCYMHKIRNFKEDNELCERIKQPAGCRGEGDFNVTEKRLGVDHGTCTLEITSLVSEDLEMYQAVFPGDQKTNKIINIKEVKTMTTVTVVVIVLIVVVFLLAILLAVFMHRKNSIRKIMEERIPCLKSSPENVVEDRIPMEPLIPSSIKTRPAEGATAAGGEREKEDREEKKEEEDPLRKENDDKVAKTREELAITTETPFTIRKEDVLMPTALKDYPFKTLLIIGKTGTGKSALCNRIAGHDSGSDIFPVSADATGCTQSTVFGVIHFNGDNERPPVNLIDTIGFDDPNNDTDLNIIAELVSKLKKMCSYVNLFAIAVNGQSPRLDGSLVAMIKIFEEMFGDNFWKQCVLIFTRIPMNEREKERRLMTSKASDDAIALNYIIEVEKKFPKSAGGLRYLFLDACFFKKDEKEVEHFNDSMEKLYNMLQEAKKLHTATVNENVQTENAKLRKALSEQMEKDSKKIKDMDHWWTEWAAAKGYKDVKM